jgi:hypothetical protein
MDPSLGKIISRVELFHIPNGSFDFGSRYRMHPSKKRERVHVLVFAEMFFFWRRLKDRNASLSTLPGECQISRAGRAAI